MIQDTDWTHLDGSLIPQFSFTLHPTPFTINPTPRRASAEGGGSGISRQGSTAGGLSRGASGVDPDRRGSLDAVFTPILTPFRQMWLYYGTDPESYITEYTLVYEHKVHISAGLDQTKGAAGPPPSLHHFSSQPRPYPSISYPVPCTQPPRGLSASAASANLI